MQEFNLFQEMDAKLRADMHARETFRYIQMKELPPIYRKKYVLLHLLSHALRACTPIVWARRCDCLCRGLLLTCAKGIVVQSLVRCRLRSFMLMTGLLSHSRVASRSNDEIEEELHSKDDAFTYGRGYRVREDVVYDDHLTERQFLKVRSLSVMLAARLLLRLR